MSTDLPVLVNCANPRNDAEWKWIAPKLPSHDRLQWKYFHVPQENSYTPTQIWTALRCVKFIKEQGADLLISHEPGMSARCSLAAMCLGLDVDHVAFAFNFPQLPTGIKLRLMKKAFERISTFVVFSEVEKKVYHEYFGIPLSKIEFIFWGVNPPELSLTDAPLTHAPYLCAVGGNARNYKQLMKAMKKLPEMTLYLVARPSNLVGLEVPSNVKIFQNIPFRDAMNIIKFSKFMVLPLKDSQVPCGHVTLVNALHLKTPVLITASTGISDYIRNEQTGLTYRSQDELIEKMKTLWDNDVLRERIGAQGQQFALQYCSEEATISYFQSLLAKRKLI